MNQLLNEEIKDHMLSKISATKNILKANDVLSKATTSFNFYKAKNKKDIMEKITNILNDKQNKENFDSCYLTGNPNDSAKNPNFKFNPKRNANTNNKNDALLKPANSIENRFFKPKEELIHHCNLNNAKEKKQDLEVYENMKKETPKYFKDEGIKAFSPKLNNNKLSLNFFDNLNIYRDTNLNRVNMQYASSNFVDKNENKIFTDKVKHEINGNDNVKFAVKNNFKLFYQQLNNSKSKQNRNSLIRESAENKPESYRDQNKKEKQDKSPKYIKCRDPESTNLFLTKFSMKNKHNNILDLKNPLINKNFSNSNSLNLNKNPELPNENNIKEKALKLLKIGSFDNKEIQLESRKKEIEQNVSKSIDIDSEADSSYYSLKNEFSFLLEKKGESEVFNLRDIINDVKTAQNKLSSECDDIKNLLKYANDTKSKLQMHKTDNRFYNVKNKLDGNNNKNFNHQAYTNNINNMIINQTNGYLKNTSVANKRSLNSNKKDKPKEKELNEERKNYLKNQEPNIQEGNFDYNKINKNKAIKLPNQNSLSADEYLLSNENPKIAKKERSRVLASNKKSNKKRNLSEANYDPFLPNIADNIGEKNPLLQAKNLTSKNQKGKNIFCLANEENNGTNNYYMIKSQMLNQKNEKEEVLKNEDLVFDPADIEIYNRQMKQGNRNQPNDNPIYDSNFKSSNNNFNSVNNEEFKHDINNKNIFDREIKTIFTSDNKRKYFVTDKINMQRLNKNFALQGKLNSGTYNSNKDLKINKDEENKADNNYLFNNFTGTNANSLKKDSKRNLKNFNEIKKQEYKRNFVFDGFEDEKLNSHENLDLNVNYKSNPASFGIKKKFSGSLNNFHKNKIFAFDSLNQAKKDPHPISINKNKISYPQQLFFKDLSANPYLKSNKNFVDKKNFLEIIKKNTGLSNNKNANKFSFERKNMSKTNYNFAEFIKSNGSIDKKTASDFYKQKNLLNEEKLVISAETNFISNNILNDGFKSKTNKNKFY